MRKKTIIGLASLLSVSFAATACDKQDGDTTPPDQAHTQASDPGVSDEDAERAARLAEMRKKQEMLDALPELPGVTKSAALDFPEPVSFTLPNGLEVLVLEDHEVAMAEVRLIVRAGDIYSPKEKPTASLVASMLTEGTKKQSKKKLDGRVDDTGGSISAGSGDETASITANVPSSKVGFALRTLSEQAQMPAFEPDSLDKLKAQTKQGIQFAKGQPQALLQVMAARVIYGQDSPYGRNFPTNEEVDSVTIEDLEAFHATHYVPNNAILVVAGDVKADAIKKQAGSAFKGWKQGKDVPVPHAQDRPRLDKPMVHIIDRKASAQATVGVFVPAPVIGEEGWLETQLLEDTLSGGLSSPLNMVLREQLGLTYGAYAFHSWGFDGGVFGGGGGTKNKTVDQFAEALIDVVFGFADREVEAQRLGQVKRKVSGGFALEVEGVYAVASRTVMAKRYGLPADFWEKYRVNVESVTPEGLRAQAAKVLDRNQIQIVAVGRRSKLERQLEGMGEIRVYNQDLELIE